MSKRAEKKAQIRRLKQTLRNNHNTFVWHEVYDEDNPLFEKTVRLFKPFTKPSIVEIMEHNNAVQILAVSKSRNAIGYIHHPTKKARRLHAMKWVI